MHHHYLTKVLVFGSLHLSAFKSQVPCKLGFDISYGHIALVIMQNSSSLNLGFILQKILVENMLSFDLSVIDIVLAIAVVVLLLLFISQRQGRPTESDSMNGRRTFFGNGGRSDKVATNRASGKFSSDSVRCAHHFGYLRDHPRNTPIPDECFGCQNVMRCLSSDRLR